jgi:membrane-associated protease RseP (regulator of RpoE activity)
MGVVAAEVDPGSPAGRAGVRPGDVLLAIDGQSIEAREDVHALQQAARRGARHVYTLLVLGDRRVAQVTLQPIPRGVGGLYYVLAAVGIFSLLVGATVRTRRPADQATLHFFWLSVAFSASHLLVHGRRSRGLCSTGPTRSHPAAAAALALRASSRAAAHDLATRQQRRRLYAP